MITFWKKRTLGLLLSSVLIMSCSTNINDLNTKINENKSFGIKSGSSTVQNTELTYTGSWVGGTVHQTTTGTVNNTSSSLVYSTNWTTINNGASSEGNYAYVNDGTNKQIADDTSASVIYTRGNWLTYSAFKYNDIYTSSKYVLTNKETDINKIKYMYNGTYNDPPQSPSTKEESWSGSMHLAWKTLTSSDGISYTESKQSTSKIEIPFTGTNIQVYQYKNSNMGQCSIKVFDSNDNEVRNLTVDNNNATWLLSKTVLSGLPNGNNKLVIQGIDGHRFNFVRAEVMPSIEYKFSGNNINYNAFTANNCGKVAVTIDNDSSTTQVIDLYDSRNIYQNVFSKTNLGSGQHTITIDGLQEKNASSSGFRINVNDFNSIPSVRGEFSGTFLNLKLIGTPNSGKADLYIDGTLNREVDMYSSGSSFYSINVTGLSDTSHTFELRAKNTKNESSTGTRINFDGYTTNKASYTFIGVGVKYFADKNNNQGFVDVFVDGTLNGRYDLYSSSLQSSQEIVNVTGLTNGEHTIDIIPVGIKRWNSSSYGINVDYLQIEEATIQPRVTWMGHDGVSNKIFVSGWDGSSWSSQTSISSTSSVNDRPQISADGNRIIWVANDGDTNRIYVSDWNGSSWTPQTNVSASSTSNDYPQISSDGNTIVWSGWTSSTNETYVSRWDGTSWSSQTLLSTSSDWTGESQISADGNRVIWTGYDNITNRIYVSDWNGSSWTEPVNLSPSSISNAISQISSNGNRVTWRGDDGFSNKIYVSEWNGTSWSTQTSISSTSAINDRPQISADGNRIIWVANDGGTNRIYVSEWDGTSWSSQTNVSGSSTGNDYPQISADGNTIVWSGWNVSTNETYVSRWDGTSWSSQTLLSTSSDWTGNSQISADGNMVIWTGYDGTQNRIYVSEWDGSAWTTPVNLSPSSNGNDNSQLNN